MKNTGNLPEQVSEPLEDILGEVRHLSRSRKRQVTLLICLSVLALITTSLNISPTPTPKPAKIAPFLSFASADASPIIDIFGDGPILRPSKYAAAGLDFPDTPVAESRSLLRPREVFEPFSSTITASRETLMPESFKVSMTLTKPEDLLEAPFWKLTETFGQKAPSETKLPPRGAAWRVCLAEQLERAPNSPAPGATILSGQWKEPPGGPDFKGRRWDVALFMVLVNDAGILGNPLMERGTGVPEIDLALAASVSREIPWAGVPAGYYRVSVAP